MGGRPSIEERTLQLDIEKEKTKQKEIELQVEKEKTKQKEAELETARFIWVQDINEVPSEKQNDVMKMLKEFKDSVMKKTTPQE